jgi:uncharacterized membrane protein
MLNMLRTTLLGGVIFLLPVVVFLLVVDKALQWIRRISDPLAASLPGTLGGHPALTLATAIAILVLICLLAGIFAHTPYAKRIVDLLENAVLQHLPFYDMLKARADSILKPDQLQDMLPVVVRFDDSWQVAYEIERIDGGAVALFLPGSPDPWSGAFVVVEEGRVSPLDLTVPIVAKIAQRLGKGANEALAAYFDNEQAST